MTFGGPTVRRIGKRAQQLPEAGGPLGRFAPALTTFGLSLQPFEGAMGERGKMQSSKELRVVHARRRRPFFRETQPFRLRIE
jgi:hypothetical protein